MNYRLFLILTFLFQFVNSAITQPSSTPKHKKTTKSYIDKIQSHRDLIKEALTWEPKNHLMPSGPVKQKDANLLRYYKPDADYIVMAHVKINSDLKKIELSCTGQKKPYVKYGDFSFKLKGKECKLTAFVPIPGSAGNSNNNGVLLIPFQDQTNGKTTFAGGRYLDLKTADIKGDSCELDFNLAYNPFCAYKPEIHCTKPIFENNLKVDIKAGEKSFGRKQHIIEKDPKTVKKDKSAPKDKDEKAVKKPGEFEKPK